jgi:cytochrome c oxidase assembly protein subunit 11
VSTSLKRRGDRFLGLKLAGLVAAMFAFGFALVPLYDVFCELTGYGGRTANAAAAEVHAAPDESRTLRVEFVANVPNGAPWEFRPAVSHLDVHPGEIYETHYKARNLTAQPLVAQAVPSVAPGPAADHFKKLECFCFTTQAFEPRETRDLKVVFMLDKELPEHVDTVSLSYTLFALSK